MKITRHLRISGRVQGVGYRAALCAAAEAGGIFGWVRNRRDGGVEALVQGTPEAVEKILEWAKRGPPGAHVTGIKTQAAETGSDQPYSGFDCLPTA